MFSEEQALQSIRSKIPKFPDTVAVLGSGWNKVTEGLKIESQVDFRTAFGVDATVPGHEGKILIVKGKKKRIALLSGRFHMYEGYSGHQATLPIRVLSQLGMKNLVLTAACGALNEKYAVGDFVVVSDVLTLLLALDNPLIGPSFVDMSQVFDPEWRTKAIRICSENRIPFHEGVYCYYHGPNYESPADKMALKFLGADVCGMSTVPETISARSQGIRVLSLAFVTNLAFVHHDHKEVVAQANKASQKMSTLLRGVLEL